jgi:N-acetylglucosaminyldiphosphoundecaprenol N-acetyl-beta-D-mannosaminyltransferase
MYFRYGERSWESAADGAGNGDGNGSAGVPPVPRTQFPADTRIERRSRFGASARLPSVTLCDVQINAVSEIECVQHILSELDAGRGGMVVTPNLDHLHRCVHDLNFAALVSEAEVVVADGMPLVWATRLLGTPVPERVAGSNLITSLSRAAAERGRKVFLLGGAPGTAAGAAEVLCRQFPSLKIVGTLCPPFGFENDPTMMADLIQAVSSAKPDIIYVALGSPKQERLILRLRPILPHAWWLGVGISFSFLCGEVRRAPRWVQKIGFEWLHRLVQEPRRLFRRYVIVGIPFALRLLSGSFVEGLPRRLGLRRRARAASAGTNGSTIPGNAELIDAGAESELPVLEALPDASGARASEVLVPRLELASQTMSRAADRSQDSGNGSRPASRLRALVLLGGAIRPAAIGLRTGRSVLDLPLDANGSVLSGWLDQAAELAGSAGIDSLPVRVMVNHRTPEPACANPRHYGAYRVERDLSEYRGTGGVLRDLANDYADDDLIVVANAAQILLEPLSAIVAELQKTGGDISVVAHEDGTPSGIMLVSCKTLRLIPETGYVDMKEQALPQIAAQYDVRVLNRRRPTGLSIRTLEDFIHALRYHHRRKAGKPAPGAVAAATGLDPLAEDWSPLFSLIETGATVDPSARIHDSIVLDGGVVEAGAVLVRSIVCPGGVLRRDKTAMETFVTADASSARRTARKGKALNGKLREGSSWVGATTAAATATLAAPLAPAAAIAQAGIASAASTKTIS